MINILQLLENPHLSTHSWKVAFRKPEKFINQLWECDSFYYGIAGFILSIPGLNSPPPVTVTSTHAQISQPIPQMTRPSSRVRVHCAHIWSINTVDCSVPLTSVVNVSAIWFGAHNVFKHAVENPQYSSYHLTSCIEFSNTDFRIFSATGPGAAQKPASSDGRPWSNRGACAHETAHISAKMRMCIDYTH